MIKDSSKIEKMLLLTLHIENYGSFRVDIYKQLDVSPRTLQRYVTDINTSNVFIASLGKDRDFPSEYVLLSGRKKLDHLSEDCWFSDTVMFSDKDTPLLSHYKRLITIYILYRDELWQKAIPSLIDDWDYDEVISSLPFGTKITKELANRYPDQEVTSRSIQRDIKVLCKVIKDFYMQNLM